MKVGGFGIPDTHRNDAYQHFGPAVGINGGLIISVYQFHAVVCNLYIKLGENLYMLYDYIVTWGVELKELLSRVGLERLNQCPIFDRKYKATHVNKQDVTMSSSELSIGIHIITTLPSMRLMRMLSTTVQASG